MPQPLARIIDQLKREPSRTGSIIITVFGDAIVPRGGSVWLGTLLEFFETLDIDSGVVRTAMSRLAADGWLERSKVGRNSFYRLVKKGRQTFDVATTPYLRSAAVGLDRALRTVADPATAKTATPRAKNSRMPVSAVRCRACGSRRRACRFPTKRRARSGWKYRPRTTADGGCCSQSWPLDRTADAYRNS